MSTLRAWASGEESEEHGGDYDVVDAETAAEMHAEHVYYSSESFGSIEVSVRVGDAVEVYDVTVDYDPQFYASQRVCAKVCRDPGDGSHCLLKRGHEGYCESVPGPRSVM